MNTYIYQLANGIKWEVILNKLHFSALCLDRNTWQDKVPFKVVEPFFGINIRSCSDVRMCTHNLNYTENNFGRGILTAAGLWYPLSKTVEFDQNTDLLVMIIDLLPRTWSILWQLAQSVSVKNKSSCLKQRFVTTQTKDGTAAFIMHLCTCWNVWSKCEPKNLEFCYSRFHN